MRKLIISLEYDLYIILLGYMCPEHADKVSIIIDREIKRHVRWQFITGVIIGSLVTAFVFIITG